MNLPGIFSSHNSWMGWASDMNQHEWVAGCLAYYAEAGMDPEPGWQEAHYPIPKCLGGTETVWLTWEHHQVQGLLQSEEYGRSCFYSGEVKVFLNNNLERRDLWDLYWKWSGENGRKNGRKTGGENVKKMHEHPNTRVPQRENGRKTGRDTVKKMHEHPNTKRTQRENGRKSSKLVNSQRWQCLVTGFVTNPGGLSSYQKARGIDTSLRERIE